MKTKRYICIHGHFYQPPRENPWLEDIELQDSAAPFHDWNSRITAECYAPNSRAKILDDQDFIEQIINNYSRISFNFGPTVLSWMRDHTPEVYKAIKDADYHGQQKFSGHGPAIAQVYNHIIMPLANRQDKITQIKWGIEDFHFHFGRHPEGMWLAETAVDIETLTLLADHDIKFTVLSPHQAKSIRPIGQEKWTSVDGGKIDPTRPYLIRLGEGKSIALFFYDGPISQAVAFEDLLKNGEHFAHRLAGAFHQDRDWNELMHIATDGETYGHHHRHGEMALAYALYHLEEENLAEITIYGSYLEKYPPQFEVSIHSHSSWSCSHGVERWRSDCGCSSGGNPNWHQQWRAPLRESLDWLRDIVCKNFESKGKGFFKDPWMARDRYIKVILNRDDTTIDDYFHEVSHHELSKDERILALSLLEMIRHELLMYTSCGWFFDEISGLETTQCLQYAARVTQLHKKIFGQDLETGFLEHLEKAPSNLPEYQNGRRVYEKLVSPAQVNFLKVGAHYAISSLFYDTPGDQTIYAYQIKVQKNLIRRSGRTSFATGVATITSKITQEERTIFYALIHFGDHNINAGVKYYDNNSEYEQFISESLQFFDEADFPMTLRIIDRHFDNATYTLKTLFKDTRRKILDKVLSSTLAEVENVFTGLYDSHYPLMNFISDIHNPQPEVFKSITEFIKNRELLKILQDETLDLDKLENNLKQIKRWQVTIDKNKIYPAFQKALEGLFMELFETPEDKFLLSFIDKIMEVTRLLPTPIDLSHCQNTFYQMVFSKLSEHEVLMRKYKLNDEWKKPFERIARSLSVRVD